MKLDTGKQGLNAIWRLYESASIEELILNDERTSSEVWTEIRFKGVDISRASVINFLNRLVEEGLVTFTERTGKGGYHRVYSLIARSWDELNDTVIDKILYKLWEIFPSNDKMIELMKC